MFNIKKTHKNYKIIPIGTYCLPRVITTFCGLKLRKKDGEKSCPFDLAFFTNLDRNIELLDNKFNLFFDNLRYDEEKHWWVNDDYNAVLNHDGELSKEELIARYRSRINNLYEYLNNKNIHLYFLLATSDKITDTQIKRLIEVIKKYRSIESFSLIIINQSKTKYTSYNENIHVIDMTKDKTFNKINKRGLWVDKLKKRKNINAIIFYYKVTIPLKKIIKKQEL